MTDLIKKRLEKFIKIVEWAIFLGLCTVSYFVIIGVWKQYQSYDSNFKKSKEPGSDAPTLLIYFRPAKNKANDKDFEIGLDFNVSYSIWGRSAKTNLVQGLNIVENNDNPQKILVTYEELKFPPYVISSAHKISSNFVPKADWAEISLHFSKSMLLQKPQVRHSFIRDVPLQSCSTTIAKKFHQLCIFPSTIQ